MPETDSPSNTPYDMRDSLRLKQATKQRDKVLDTLVEKLKPWLFEFGNWIFGGLIAFNLVIVAPLLTLNPIHPEILASIAAFVCALPLNVSGIFLVKLIRDMNDVAIDDVMKQAFEEANIPRVEESFPSKDKAALHKKRTDVGLRYSVRIAALSIVLTLLGMVAILWYIAWWISTLFIVMVILSLVMTLTMITRLMRPDAEAEREMRQRYQDQRNQREH